MTDFTIENECPHTHKITYRPPVPFVVQACTKCGYTTVSAAGNIVYETYLSVPILIGLGSQLYSVMEQFFRETKKR